MHIATRRLCAALSVGSAIVAIAGGCGETANRATSTKMGGSSPRLGVAYEHTEGLGKPQPTSISTGGDGTTVVQHIHWTHWGSAEAMGTGEAVWVWPGTCNGCNGFSRARIVAFHLGTCEGRPSYNAVEWYFPEYDGAFSKTRFLELCPKEAEGWPRWTGVQSSSTPPLCPPARLVGGGAATEMTVEHISCMAASAFVGKLPPGSYKKERRFVVGSFRCGTQGSLAGPPTVQCAHGSESILFTANY